MFNKCDSSVFGEILFLEAQSVPGRDCLLWRIGAQKQEWLSERREQAVSCCDLLSFIQILFVADQELRLWSYG